MLKFNCVTPKKIKTVTMPVFSHTFFLISADGRFFPAAAYTNSPLKICLSAGVPKWSETEFWPDFPIISAAQTFSSGLLRPELRVTTA